MSEEKRITYVVQSKPDDVGADTVNDIIEGAMCHSPYFIMETADQADFNTTSWFCGFAVGTIDTLKNLECICDDCAENVIAIIMNKFKMIHDNACKEMEKHES